MCGRFNQIIIDITFVVGCRSSSSLFDGVGRRPPIQHQGYWNCDSPLPVTELTPRVTFGSLPREISGTNST